jgi:2',3'-cyclic-nucleotide 2'-phosphodiesterase/3'-nucleotidase
LFDTEAEYGEEQGTIRNLTIRYLTEQKHGTYEGKPQQRWQLVGLDDSYNEQREIVKTLINSGEISVPSSEDGRYTNIASINVKDWLFTSAKEQQKALALREAQLVDASEGEKRKLEREIALIKALN